MSSDVKAVLGTMTFGNQVDLPTADKMTRYFLDNGHTEIDTAYVYTDGESETILGKILKNVGRDTYLMATKANPSVKGNLKPAAVEEQLNTSLERLGLDYVDIFYLHMPDPGTPIAVTLEACDKLYRQGKFKTLGLSNYAAWHVAQIACISGANSWITPTVYQGMYNALTRQVEMELFPSIREYALSFYVYNPLSGGLLTGRYRGEEGIPEDGRFKLMESYRDRYWQREFFDAVDVLGQTCDAAGIPMTSAALTWLTRHSDLIGSKGDGIIIGASKFDHLKQNLEYMAQPPLSDEVADQYGKAWDLIKGTSPKYFRP